MAVGSVLTLALLIAYATGIIPSEDGVYANDPIYWGLGASLLVYIVVSYLTPPTEPEVREAWDRRVTGAVSEDLPLEAHPVASHAAH
jgi:SSS family solute:Na+ symporter